MLLIDFVDGHFLKNSKMHFENNVKWISVCIFLIDLSFDQQLSNLKKLSLNIYCFITASPIAWFTELHKQFPSTFDWWRWWRKRFSHIRCIYNHTRKMLQPDDVTQFKYNHDIMCEIFSRLKSRIGNSEWNMLNIKKQPTSKTK